MSANSHTFDLGDTEIFTDPNKVVYVQSFSRGEAGAIALPFIGKYVQSVVLSGAGGGLSVTLIEREQEAGGLDIQELLRNAINLSENEVLDTFHPAVDLYKCSQKSSIPLTMLAIGTMTISIGARSCQYFMTEGMSDAYTPPESIEIPVDCRTSDCGRSSLQKRCAQDQRTW